MSQAPRGEGKRLTRIINHLPYIIGRRGSVLLFLGLLDVLFGYSFLTAPPSFVKMVNYFLPYMTWGIIWIVVGFICLVSAFWKRDRLAFTVAVALKSAWGLANEYVWIHQGIPRAWIGAVIWLAFAGLVVVISSWPESPEILRGRKAAES